MNSSKSRALNPLFRRVTLAFLVLFLVFSVNAYGIIIIELMPKPLKPAGGDEWIELYNETDVIVNLRDWHILDQADNGGEICTNDVELLPGKYLILCKNYETETSLNLDPEVQVLIPVSWTPLNNDGDRLTLLDSDSGTVDIIEYGSEAGDVAGRSWERIDCRGSGIDRSNWGSCADINGHTAGRANSLQNVTTDSRTKVRVDPNPFNPYQGESTNISFEIPAPKSRISVDIFDSAGRKVRKLVGNIPAGTQNPVLCWDGRNDGNRLLPIGRYIVLLQAVDIDGGRMHTAKCTVVLADRLK